jgi:hypothetical protein
MDLSPNLTAAPHIKVMINIGACFDINTGTYLFGRYGEMILNGGLSTITGVVGIGNNFKSTIMHYMMLRAMARMVGSKASTYDTEVNIHEWHLHEMIQRIPEFKNEEILQTGRWVITDKTMYFGETWYKANRDFLEAKLKQAAKIQVETPFWNRDRTAPMTISMPSFSEVDSLTEFETSDVAEMQSKNELGESGGNMIHQRQGLAKTRILMEAPRLNTGSYNYLLMTAHIGKESTLQNAGPGGSVPIVKLKHLKNGDKIKGTTDKFTFVTHNCWHAYNATPFINQGTKSPEYPRNAEDNLALDTDLNTVQLRNLRSKSGVAGMVVTLLVSQTEGVLPSLTEFHHIKENGRYGLDGNNVSYCLEIYPDVTLMRTTVRGKIDSDPKLQRALNITSEMCQIDALWHNGAAEMLVPPKQLYTDLKEMGHSWDTILETRGWWTFDNEFQDTNYLSTYDILRMRAKQYIPYWYSQEQVAALKDIPEQTLATWKKANGRYTAALASRKAIVKAKGGNKVKEVVEEAVA